MRFILLALLLFAPLVRAQTQGSPAPDFTMGGLSAYSDATTRADCLGSVIIIKIWGIT